MGNYKKLIFLFLVTVFGGNFLVIGQVKIGGNPSIINANSALEIEASDKGLLLPRIALASTTSVAPLTNTVVAGMTVYNTATNGDVTPGFYYYNGAKWIRVADAAAGTVTASNGLIVSGNDVKLGGALVSPTIITTDATNTFALTGLQTGLVTDDVVLSSGGVVKKIDAASFLNGTTTVSNTSAANDLTTTVNGKTGLVVSIVNSNVLSVTGTDLTSTVNGISSTPVDLTSAIAGATSVSNTSLNNDLSTTVNGVTGVVVPIINSNALSSSVNTLTSTVNGIVGTTASIINSNGLTNTNGSLVSIVNGVTAAGVPVLISSSNGLTTTNGDVKLGGALTVPTTITTDLTNTLTLAGLQTGQDTDDLITTNAAGMLTRSPKSTVPTIYTADGTLTNSRRVTQGANSLTFDGTSVTGGSTTFDNNSGSSIRVFAKEDTGRANVTLATNITSLDSSINGGAAQIIANGSTDFSIGTSNASDLSFSTAGSQQLRISGATGKVFLEKNLVIYSNGATNTSGLQLYELKNTSPETAGAGAIGVDGGGNVVRVPVISSSSNGLTTTVGDVKLGGTLTTPTTVTTDVTNTLTLAGLQTGAATDDFVTATAAGVLTRSPKSAVPTIYSTNGSLTDNREVAQGDKFLRFNGTKGSVLIDNVNGPNVSLNASVGTGRSNISLAAGPTSLYSFVDGGSGAYVSANGATNLTIGTSDAAGLSLMTKGQQRIYISGDAPDEGKVYVRNSMEINASNTANTSGLRFSQLTAASPETVGAGAIGVDLNGDVVRVSTVSSPFSAKQTLVIYDTSSSPTKAATRENDFVCYRDLGNNQIEIDFLYSAANSAGATNGSGDYLFELPNGYNFSAASNPVFNTPITDAAQVNAALPFILRDVKMAFAGSGGTSTAVYIIPYDSFHFRLVSISNNIAIGNASNGMAGTTAVYGGRFTFVKQ